MLGYLNFELIFKIYICKKINIMCTDKLLQNNLWDSIMRPVELFMNTSTAPCMSAKHLQVKFPLS